MDNIFGELGNVDNKDEFINVARFRLKPEEFDVTKDMVITAGMAGDKEVVNENISEPLSD